MKKIYALSILVFFIIYLLFFIYLDIKITLGDIWYYIHSNSLIGLQRIVGEKFDPDPTNPTLYFKIILPVLQTNLLYLVVFILLIFFIKIAVINKKIITF